MSTKRISLYIIQMSVLAVHGCGIAKSRVDVELYGQRLPLNITTKEKDSVFWAYGNNSDAFKPAIYAPYPGPKREWCLYVNLDISIALLVERFPNSDTSTAFLVRSLIWARSNEGIKGHGIAKVLKCSLNKGMSTSAMDTKVSQESRIDFFLHKPKTANQRPSEAESFMPIIQSALTN